MNNAIVTTTLDGEEIGRSECQPDNYVLVVGPEIEVTSEQVYANGTRVITLKALNATAPHPKARR